MKHIVLRVALIVWGLLLLQQGGKGQPDLSYAQVVGKEPIRTVRLRQEGVMRTQPGKPWLPLVAQQYFTATPPAVLWQARIQLFPFVWISATEQFSQGCGTMRIKLLSVIPMGNARGPEMDQSELQRYLAEMIWFPTALIEWHVIDAHSVKATMCKSGVMAPAVLHVNAQGQLTHVTANRYKEEHGHYLLAPGRVSVTSIRKWKECASQPGLSSPGISHLGISPGFAVRLSRSNITNQER